MFAFLQQRRHEASARKGFRTLAYIGDGTLADIGTSRSALLEMAHLPASEIDAPAFDLTRALARSTGG